MLVQPIARVAPNKVRIGLPSHYARQCRAHASRLLASPDDSTEGTIISPIDRPVLAAVDAAALRCSCRRWQGQPQPGRIVGHWRCSFTAFLVAWFATSPLTGVYNTLRKMGDGELQEAFLQVVPAWDMVIPLGCVLRGILKRYVPSLSFVVVTLIATLVILGGARVLFTVVEDFV